MEYETREQTSYTTTTYSFSTSYRSCNDLVKQIRIRRSKENLVQRKRVLCIDFSMAHESCQQLFGYMSFFLYLVIRHCR